MKTFARKWLLPPGINQLLTDAPPPVKRLWGGQTSRHEPIQLNPSDKKAATLDELLIAPDSEIVWVETDKIRIGGGALTWRQNNHVRYYKDGIDSYRRFFELHQPRDQFEFLMVDSNCVGDFTSVRFPKNRKPWSFEYEYGGEGRLGKSHGTQEHGPVSRKLLLGEQKRLDSIRESVAKKGFLKLSDDFIAYSEILLDDSRRAVEDYRVLLSNGAHRASLLAHLGWPLIPMMPQPEVPIREVLLSNLGRWPGVLDGTFSEEAARAYFWAHFRAPNEELLPGW